MMNDNELYQIYLKFEPDVKTAALISDAMTTAKLKKLMKYLGYDPYAKKITRKADLCLAAARMLTHPRLFEDFFGKLSEEERALLSEAVFDWGLHIEEVFPRLGLKIPEERFGSYYNVSFPMDSFFNNLGYNGSLTMAWQLQNILRSMLPHPKIDLHLREDIPDEENFLFSEEEGRELFENLNPLLSLLQDGGYFDKEAAKGILKSTRNKIAKLYQFTPFTDEETTRSVYNDEKKRARLINFRADLILKFFSVALLQKGKEIPEKSPLPVNPLEFLRECTRSFLSAPHMAVDMKYFLPHLKISGKTAFMIRHRKSRGENLSRLTPYLETWPTNHFVNFTDFLKSLRITGMPRPIYPDREFYTVVSSDDDYYDGYKEREYCSTQADYREMVYEPYFHGLFFMFAALGFFEITWNFPLDSMTEDYYALGEIVYIRMTGLGAAVFGLTDDYDGGEEEEYERMRLNPDHPVILVDPRDRAARIFLEKFSDPLGESSFRINPEKLRKACPAKEDLEELFQSLNRYTGEELPPFWRNMHEDLQQSYITLKPQYDWIVFDVPEDNPGLMNFLSRVPDPCFVRMEGLRIALLRKDLTKFKNMLRKEGYSLILPG